MRSALFLMALGLAGCAAPTSNVSQQQTQGAAQVSPLRQVMLSGAQHWKSLCESSEYSPYFRKSPCNLQDMTPDQMSDLTTATEAERAVISKIEIQSHKENRALAEAFRQYGGPHGAQLAEIRERLAAESAENLLALHEGKLTWGEYNHARRQMYEKWNSEARRVSFQ